MAVDKKRRLARVFLAESGVYGVLVAVYFVLVLRFLAGWLKDSYDHERALYAIVSLLLMLGQGVLLEAVTSGIFRVIKGRRR